MPCRVLGWCGWATIDGLRFVDPDAELRERLSRRTVKSLSMVAGSRFRGNDGRVGRAWHHRVGVACCAFSGWGTVARHQWG